MLPLAWAKDGAGWIHEQRRRCCDRDAAMLEAWRMAVVVGGAAGAAVGLSGMGWDVTGERGDGAHLFRVASWRCQAEAR
eukprot:34239-Eustigmatos_ZCMA.PRE.1